MLTGMEQSGLQSWWQPYPDIWGFAVAAVSEGLELRAAGITKPILILGYTFEEDYETMIQNDIRPAVFTERMAKAFDAAAARIGKRAPIHIAVDTGMSLEHRLCRSQQRAF